MQVPLEVIELSKIYNNKEAVKKISFRAEKMIKDMFNSYKNN